MTRRPECSTRCIYCDNPLASRHEHDHFPVPSRSGGDRTACVCINCHDLVDRDSLNNWDATVAIAAFFGLFARATTTERIFLAKMFRLTMDAQRDERRSTR